MGNATKRTVIHVYVLALEGGRFYVGQGINLKRRFTQHAEGEGSSWTRLHPPVAMIEVIPTAYADSKVADAKENEVTIDYMRRFGWRNVRGGFFCNTDERQVLLNLHAHGHFLDEAVNDAATKDPGLPFQSATADVGRAQPRGNTLNELLARCDATREVGTEDREWLDDRPRGSELV